MVVIVNTAVGFVQDYKSEKTMENLRRMSTPVTRVLRGGRIVEVATTAVVKVCPCLVLCDGNHVLGRYFGD